MDPTTPRVVYASKRGQGLFRSTDSGATWRGLGLHDPAVLALAIDPWSPTTLYAATGFAGVSKSTDGGAAALRSALPPAAFAGARRGGDRHDDGQRSKNAVGTPHATPLSDRPVRSVTIERLLTRTGYTPLL